MGVVQGIAEVLTIDFLARSILTGEAKRYFDKGSEIDVKLRTNLVSKVSLIVNTHENLLHEEG